MNYRLKVISDEFGIDFEGPLHPTEAHAALAAQTMLQVHSGRVVVEVHKQLDRDFRTTKVVARFEK